MFKASGRPDSEESVIHVSTKISTGLALENVEKPRGTACLDLPDTPGIISVDLIPQDQTEQTIVCSGEPHQLFVENAGVPNAGDGVGAWVIPM
jgi:hypothetical protein